MIVFDPSMFLSNFITEALDSFKEIWITSTTLQALMQHRENKQDTVTSKKAAKAIDIIYSNPKIIITNKSGFMLSQNENNTLFFADKYSYLYYKAVRDASCKAGFQLYIPKCDSNFMTITSSEEIIANPVHNGLNLKPNDYICFINAYNKKVLYKVDKDTLEYKPVRHQTLNSILMGETKPKIDINGDVDIYQLAAIDSLRHNQMTLLSGKAGTGKSYLAMAALFTKLRLNEIDRIYIFCNPVATRDSAKLGFYPGDKDSKLLDSQIGNFLDGKIGDRIGVERLINQGVLCLLPMSDIRGFDTNGKKAGIYITEAQNTTVDLMQLALERVGEDSICIIDGDYNRQVDLDIYADINNGMRRVSQVYRGSDFYGQVCLENVYRSKIAELAAQMTL